MRIAPAVHRRALDRPVLDIIFVLAIVALIAGIALVAKAVERL